MEFGNQQIIMHINYCEQGQTLAEACNKAVDWGYDGIEFRTKRINTKQSDEEYLDEVVTAVQSSGLKQVIFGYPTVDLTMPVSTDRKIQLERAIQFYEKACERFNLTLCNALAGPLINKDKSIPYTNFEQHGSFISTQEHYDWAVEGFRALGDVAQRLGFRFAFETHMNYIHDLPTNTKKLVDMINHPAIGANLDFGNTVFYKKHETLEESIEVLNDKIYYVHFKNSLGLPDGSRFATTISEGDINHRTYLKLLDKSGYDGPICLEAPRPGDREWFAQQDIKYIRNLLTDLCK